MQRAATRARIALALLPFVAACASETPAPDTNAAPGAVFNVPAPAQQSFALHSRKPEKAAASTKTVEAIPAQRSVYYDLDRYDIKPEFRPAIEAHARYLRAHPNTRVSIQGNGDERGSREYNLGLGQRRSDNVKKMLTLLGAREDQIESVSLGEEKPVCADHSEQCWAKNRRGDMLYNGEY